MGRKGSRLIPFLKDALLLEKYKNLMYRDVKDQVFILNLPRKTPHLDKNCEHILKDWYERTGRKYQFNADYSEGKQAMEAALKKSDFLLRIQTGNKKELIYRFLNDYEVKEKKSKKIKKKTSKRVCLEDEHHASSPSSSRYGSGSSPAGNYAEMKRACLEDEDYTSSPQSSGYGSGSSPAGNDAETKRVCLEDEDYAFSPQSSEYGSGSSPAGNYAETKRACLEDEDYTSSPQSSGYGSGSSPAGNDAETKRACLEDEDYAFSPQSSEYGSGSSPAGNDAKTTDDCPSEQNTNNCENNHPTSQKEGLLNPDPGFENDVGVIQGTDCNLGNCAQIEMGDAQNDLCFEDITGKNDWNQVMSGDLLQCDFDHVDELFLNYILLDSDEYSVENDMLLLGGRLHSSQDMEGFQLPGNSFHPFDRQIQETLNPSVALVSSKIQYNLPAVSLD